jgi:hypothetical protein
VASRHYAGFATTRYDLRLVLLNWKFHVCPRLHLWFADV